MITVLTPGRPWKVKNVQIITEQPLKIQSSIIKNLRHNLEWNFKNIQIIPGKAGKEQRTTKQR